MSRRVLVVVPSPSDSGPALSDAFRKSAPALKADLAAASDDIVALLGRRSYDAVVCWADRPEELDLVVRIRATSLALRIVVVSSSMNAAFRSLVFGKGTSSILTSAQSLPKLAAQIEQAVVLGVMPRRTVARAREACPPFATEVREAVCTERRPGEEPRRRLPERFRLSPLPLLVSNDPDESLLMLKAFAQADMYAPLPILQSSEEAVAYLSGQAPFSNREFHPLPSLILLDFHGPGGAGLELLGWIRQQARLKHLPVIVLSAAVDREDIKGAYGLQANSYLIKPGNFDELVDMVKAIKHYWSSLNVSPES